MWARRRKPDTDKADLKPPFRETGGQGVHREVESEGHEEKYRAVIDGGHPKMNRSAKGGTRSSPHYRGEGVLIHPTVPRCVRTARYGRTMRDLRRTDAIRGWHRDKQTYKRERNGK
jgi:hypothetical protein